jgi:hypothetical protein
VANLPPGVNDTGGKIAAGINDTCGKFATGINGTGGKFCHQWQILPPVSVVLLIPVANLPPVSTIPAANLPPVSHWTLPTYKLLNYQHFAFFRSHRGSKEKSDREGSQQWQLE